MIITNKFNLPKTIVNVVKRPQYTKGKAKLSITEIMNSPRIVQLRKKHEAEIEQDVADMVWSIFGTAVHGLLEHGKDSNHLIEERIHLNVDGWDISGAIDLQTIEEDGIIISDYKTTSAWAVMNEKIEWTQQLNMYAHLVEAVKGITVKRLEIVAIIRDWSRRDSLAKESYPEAPIKVISIPMWTASERAKYLADRLTLHAEAEFVADMGDTLPPCTPAEMWEKASVWAVKKTGGARAKAVCSSLEEAQERLAEYGNGHEIEHRPGERTRCANFCPVSQFCEQYKSYKENQ